MNGRDENLFLLGRLCERFGLGDGLRYVDEIAASPLLPEFEAMVANVPSFDTKKFDSVFEFRLFRIALYTLVREIRPQTMIETGVLHGMTSAFVLEAMVKNAAGKLISVDLPSTNEEGPSNKDGIQAVLPEARRPGWIVAKRLTSNWRLELGDSREVLPRIFREHAQIEIFLHDSDHVYSVMWDEMTLAWQHLRDGGFLVCDNIDYSRAFFDLCRRVERIPFVLSSPNQSVHSAIRFGIVRK